MKTQLKSALRTISAVALATAAISLASAQSARAFNTTMEGRGSAHFDGQTYNFTKLQVTLQNNNRVTVHALLDSFDSKDLVFSGRLSDRSKRTGRLSADLDNVGYGTDSNFADALCDIDMSGSDRFNTVTITGRNKSDRNGVSLDFVSNGRVVKDYQPPRGAMGDDQRRRNQDRGRNGNGNGNANDRSNGQGRYTETEEWRNHGDHFVLKYTLDLNRRGDARLVADSVEDRNMPNDKDNRHSKGDILKYLQRGHNVIQTGTWTQDGDRITIRFDTIEYGDTHRSKNEVWKGRLRGANSLRIDDFEQSFYGHDVTLTFDQS